MSLGRLGSIKKIGLIAGNGKFPLLFAKAAANHGLEVIAIAIKGDTSRLITAMVKRVYWLTLREYSSMFDIFEKEGIKKVLMAGQVNPKNLFYRDIGDEALKKLLAALKDKRPDTVFGAVAEKLAERSIELVNSTMLLEHYMPQKGVLTKSKPSASTMEDIRLGFDIAKSLAALDIGQTLVVKNGAIVAVEAIEGTDAAIVRGGRVANGGVVVIKVSKPNQDMRFDVPVVGLRTIKYLVKAGAKCLAIDAGKTLVIDQERCIELADRKNISIVVC